MLKRTSLLVTLALWGCANSNGTTMEGMGGSPATGGTSGSAGATGSGGSATGGERAGEAGAGGGSATGGSDGTGGLLGTGGASSSGAGGAAGAGSLDFSYWLGADVSFEETQPDATRANLLSTLKAHGFNSIRLRTFVDPKAADGYDKSGGAADLAHTIAFGKQIKAAGMGFLVDFHYSDNWADPGKQCVPIKWQTYTTITDLATAVHDYTKDAITQLIASGARPDMVQIGNETTPGMLIHRCDSGGSPTGTNPVTGSTSNWANLGALLKAGVNGVKEVDPKILVSFHIAKGGDHTDGTSALSTSVSWLTNALKYTSVDAFGESCYQTFQGDASSASHSKTIWQTTEGGMASKFPNIKIFAAEYGGAPRELNDVVFGLPNQQGLGTFFWEPTVAGSWNPGVTLLGRSGSAYTVTSNMAVFDPMKTAYASRL
jgi:arabinogalactan endo-1,4-beta-galactosidase